MLLAKAAGIDPSTILEIIQASAFANNMFASKGQAMIERRFTPNFVVRNLLKDLTLAEEAAAATLTPMPFNGLTREIFLAAVQSGFGDEDYCAVVKVMERMTGQTLG